MRKMTLGITLSALAFVAVFGQNAQAQQYTLTQIPLPNLSSYPASANVSGAYVIGYGLNNGGQVVGNVGGIIGNAPTQPFIYQQGSSELLPYLAKPEDYATASAINLNGIIVGQSENSSLQGNAVSWQNGSITFLGSLYYIQGTGVFPAPAGYSSAVAINSRGAAVGSATLETGNGNSVAFPTHAVLYSGGTIMDLGTLGGADSEALGINDSGMIVGDSQTATSTLQHAFYYNGAMQDLGVLPGGTESTATAINSSGTIVGQSTLTGGAHAVEWIPNGAGGYSIQDLGSVGPLAGNYSQANAINSSGQIVGLTDTPQNTQDAFIYSNGVMTDLNTLLPAGSSVTLHEATAINDSGQILAYSLDYATNVRTAYLLTPNFPAPVTVPNVVGVTQTVAGNTIAAADLNVGIVSIQNSGTVPAGVVISEAPAAGSSLRVGAAVNLAVSSGKVAVPSVVGLANAAATSLLTSAGLMGTVSYQYSSTASGTAPFTTISQQSPVAGTLVAQGSPISLVVLTPLFVTVPNLIGLSLNDGEIALTAAQCAAHISLIEIGYESSKTVPAGTVISQSPVPGNILGISGVTSSTTCPSSLNPTVVNIVVSSGPVQVMVPNVVGVTQAAATTLITTPGLVVGSVTTQPSSTVPSGSVISQSPAAGTNVAIGGPVNIVVSNGPATISIVPGGAPVFTGNATGYSVTVPLKNTGNVTAQTVQEISATLNGIPAKAGTTPPITLAPGATGNLVLNFLSPDLGVVAVLSVSGSYSGTALSGNWSFGTRASLCQPLCVLK